MNKTDIEVIKAAKILVDYCKNHTNTCKDCPFYMMHNNCALGYDIPEGWEVREYE